MSQLKTYEAATIEEALRAVTIDLGDDIEIVEAVKERRGGVMGFFARECFVVTARSKTADAPPEAEAAFSEMLLEMASGVADTWDSGASRPAPLASRVNRAEDAAAPTAALAPDMPTMPEAKNDGRPSELPDLPPLTRPAAHSPAQAGVIDLRTGRRRPAPMVPLLSAASDPNDHQGVDERPTRPSHLRRRLQGGDESGRPEQIVMEVDGPMIDLRDSAPRWSLARLQMLHLPDSVLEAIELLDPGRDLEWVQSLSIAISKLKPLVGTDQVTYVIGHGRRSAPELIRGIPRGRIPTAIIIDGVRVKVTPDELALSIRACIR